MGIESFRDKFKGPEPFPEDIDIDKVPPPESYQEPMPEDSEEVPGTVSEEELIEEDEVEEIYREKPEEKERTLVSEKIKDDLKINEKIVELQSAINKIQQALKIETDVQRKKMFEDSLKDAQSELDRLLEGK